MPNIIQNYSRNTAKLKELYKYVGNQHDFNMYIRDLVVEWSQGNVHYEDLEEIILDLLDPVMLANFTKDAIKIKGYQPFLCWVFALIHYASEETNKSKMAKKAAIQNEIGDIQNDTQLRNFIKHHKLDADKILKKKDLRNDSTH